FPGTGICGVADAVYGGQGQRPQYRRLCRQQRPDVDVPGPVPPETLGLPAVRRPRPAPDTEKTEPHPRAALSIVASEPGISPIDVDSELFVQFTPEREEWLLAPLDLAAWKLPVAGINLAGGPLAQEKAAVFAQNYRRRDLDPLR